MKKAVVTAIITHLAFLMACLLFLGTGRLMLLLTSVDFGRYPYGLNFLAFSAGFPQDLSVAGYLLAALHVGFLISIWWNNLGNRLITGIWITTWLVASVLYSVEAAILPEWHTKLSVSAIYRLRVPSEIISVAGNIMLLRALTVLIVLIGTGMLCWLTLLRPVIRKYRVTQVPIPALLSWMLVIPVLIIEIRGSVSRIPVSDSTPVFSEYPEWNQAASNTLWNLGQDIVRQLGHQDTVMLMDVMLADRLVASYCSSGNEGPCQGVIIGKPDIVMVVLESWSAACMGSLHPRGKWTPHFDRLSRSGLLFSRMYASGWTSDVGLAATFCGAPGMVKSTYIDQFCLGSTCPSIFRTLASNGYRSHFITGSDLDYANLRGFLRSAGVQQLTEQRDLDTLPSGSLGPYDGPVLEYSVSSIITADEPALTAIFTQSTHAPYAIPDPDGNETLSEEDLYLNSLRYADSCLGAFMDRLRQSSRWDSMLVILVADHSHDTPWNDHLAGPERNRIPFLITGGALPEPFRGVQINTICAQYDIPAIMLEMFGLPAHEFPFSRPILNTTNPGSAYYTYYQGIGLVTDSGAITYDLNRRSILYEDPMSPRRRWQQMMLAKAVLQAAMARLALNQGC